MAAVGRTVAGGFSGQKPAGVDQATWDKAQEACKGLRPTGSGDPRGDDGASEAYRNCLTEHGVDPSQDATKLNTTDPTVAEAVKVCAALRPA